MDPVLEIRELDKGFIGVHAVDHVSFKCEPGTVHVLQGENGTGKSTILKMLSEDCGTRLKVGRNLIVDLELHLRILVKMNLK